MTTCEPEPVTARSNIDVNRAFRAASSYSPMGVDMAAKGALHNSYYMTNLQNMVLLKSDWRRGRRRRAPIVH
jgi:hypothetical protein